MNKLNIDKFVEMTDSLRKHQRAELFDSEQNNLIDKLYTDPLEGDFVLKSMLANQTTLLIGRKGTGKSTIISKLQHEIRKDKKKLSLYLDVRTIYEQSISSIPANAKILNGLSPEEQNKHELYKHFLKAIIQEIHEEINKDLFVNRFVEMFWGGITEKRFKERLDTIKKSILTPKFDDITGLKQTKKNDDVSHQIQQNDEKGISSELNPKITEKEFSIGSLKLSSSSKSSKSDSFSNKQEYTNLLIRYFNIIEFIGQIRELLSSIGVEQVFICLDDASELDKEALDIFMRTIVAPLHNDSYTFFRFKIAFYPSRDYLPNIDRTKIDTLYLDFYDLYKSSGVDRVETEAISYTKRLLETRFKYYLGQDFNFEEIFDINTRYSLESYYKLIFQITANVPRNIGKLLWFVSKRSIIRGEKIDRRVLREAAREQYILDFESILTKSEYFKYKNYEEKYEREHLRRLLDLIIIKAKENKRQIGNSKADIFRDYSTNNAPSNYLFIPPNLEKFLLTLELNFFISKFTQQKDKGSGSGDKYTPPKEVNVYTLNYGLCQKENIVVDEGSDRKFRTERLFDYTDLILEWAMSAQVVRCSNCDAKFDIKEWETIQSFHYFCKICHQQTCFIETIEPDEVVGNVISDDIKIREADFDVLNTLRIEGKLSTQQISEEVDSSERSIRQRVRQDRFLMQNGMIERKPEGQENKYQITKKALGIYFANDEKPSN